MKVFGAFLILYGSLFFGLHLCREEKQKLALLQELLSALEQLQGELELRSAPLPELFTAAANCTQGETGVFLRDIVNSMANLGEESFSELWTRHVQRSFSALPADVLDQMLRLGRLLGKMDLEAELRALSGCRNSVSHSLEQLREKLPSRQRLTLALSAAAGLVAVILMI